MRQDSDENDRSKKKEVGKGKGRGWDRDGAVDESTTKTTVNSRSVDSPRVSGGLYLRSALPGVVSGE